MDDPGHPSEAGALPQREASPSEIEAAWDREIEARIAAYERGETRTYPADAVFTEARRLIQERQRSPTTTSYGVDEILARVDSSAELAIIRYAA
jgi:Putative addiction module component